MKKIDIQKYKSYINNKAETEQKKIYIQNPKKLFLDRTIEKRFNNTTFINYNNLYLDNSNNLLNFKDNRKVPLQSKRVSTPKTMFTKINNYKVKKNRPKSSNAKKLPKLSNNNVFPLFSPSNYLSLETEKMNYEKFQLNKLVKNLEKELHHLQKENEVKDKLLNNNEKEITDIINNSNLLYEENDNKNNKYDVDSNNKQNNSSLNLYIKIKKEIKMFNNEIKEEEKKINELKHNILYTKAYENFLEKNLLEKQIKKISSLIDNALIIKENNIKKMKEINYIKSKINTQKNIINELKQKNDFLYENHKTLENEIKNNESNLLFKRDKVNRNIKEIKLLIKKNNKISQDKVIRHKLFRVKNNNPISINSSYLKKISELQKLVKFYKNQNEYSESIINKLIEQKKSSIESMQKGQHLKYSPSFLSLKPNNKSIDNKGKIVQENNTANKDKEEKIKKENDKDLNINTDEEKIEKLRIKYQKLKQEEKEQEEKFNECLEKVNKLNEYIMQQNINKENNDLNTGNEKNQNEIEFGIDENNPYYTENEDNQPEIENKFTSTQFNQFTYILFKNFESKGIVSEESNNKIIKPFIKVVNDNKLEIVQYPSEQFNFIVEEFTKIILDSINSENEYNHSLTKIFISALLINSECNTKKLIEYFSILFSYTRNYCDQEEKYLSKLRNKYRNQINKLIKCVNIYTENSKKEKNEEFSEYFPLIRIKEVIEENNINLKDKYVEFLFYFLKKFNDSKAKLEELKYSLLNDIMISIDNNKDEKIENKEKVENNKTEEIKETKEISYKDKSESKKSKENINIDTEKKDINNHEEKNAENKVNKSDNITTNNNIINTNKEIQNYESENINLKTSKDNSNKNFNSEKKVESNNNIDESMTEITNEEYIKQINEALGTIKDGIKKKNVTFSEFINDIKQNVQVDNNIIEFFTIDDFNEKLKDIGIIFSDLKLSCLCSKYSLPNDLRLLEMKKIEEDINSN